MTPFVLAGLVLIAVAFIVVVVIAGTGGGQDESGVDSPAPVAPAGGEPAAEPAEQTAEALGYPAFATNNTTRIGGSDPAATAAAVALAVFPSTTDSQRPAAVALVGEDDWAGAIAATVLMAEPLRAPVLISGSSLPDASAEALEALDPTGVADDDGTQAYAVGAVEVPDGTKAAGVSAGPAATEAAAIAKLRDRLFPAAPAGIVVAPSSKPEIAMPAAAWAARSGDPVLFAGADELPAATATALHRHTKVPVYVLGPTSAISSKVLKEIGKIVKSVKRASGEDPVANAIAFARYGDGDFGWRVNDPGHGFVLAREDPPVIAGATAALSGSGTWGPLLLSDSATKLPAELRSYFLDVKPGYSDNPTRAFYNHVWVIGDQEAIDVNQQAEVNELAELAKIGGGG
jgi:ell wall binding domain 2 (CWB2)